MGYRKEYKAVSNSLKRKVRMRDKMCVQCGSGLRLEVDHIVPESEGGSSTDMSNLQLLCGSCHDAKTREEIKRAKKKHNSMRYYEEVHPFNNL